MGKPGQIVGKLRRRFARWQVRLCTAVRYAEQTISATRHIDDPILACSRRVKRLAQGRDLDVEVGLLDNQSWPDPGHQLVLRNERAFCAGQYAQDLERAV